MSIGLLCIEVNCREDNLPLTDVQESELFKAAEKVVLAQHLSSARFIPTICHQPVEVP